MLSVFIDVASAMAVGPSKVRVDGWAPGESSADSLTHSPGGVGGGGVREDPLTCAIASVRLTTVEIRKGKTALGIRVLGGNDTSIVRSILI